MKILFLGDIVGRSGRDVVLEQIPVVREELGLDFVIVNAENSAHGFGLTSRICKELYAAGVDCITTGNHVWDQREIISYIEKDERLIRPVNYPELTPGKGFTVLKTEAGKKILVINVMGRLFMDALDDPFAAIEDVLRRFKLGKNIDAIVIDVHAEANSEKMAMGHICDGRVSLVVGTHTHIPTGDAQIFSGGTGYQTDAGMCGDYDSVIGMEKKIAINRFIKKVPGERLRPAEEAGTACGVYIETDDRTGLCQKIIPYRSGSHLHQSKP